MIFSNTWNHLTVWKRISNVFQQIVNRIIQVWKIDCRHENEFRFVSKSHLKMCFQIMVIIYIYIYNMMMIIIIIIICGDRDEAINHIISECSKLAQKEYKARHDWVGKVIHWEMWRKFQFDHTNKWYMHNPHLSLKITRINSYGALIYKRIT